MSVPAVCKDGSRISVEFTITPFHYVAGKVLGIAAIMRDVTMRFEAMKALRRRRVDTGRAEVRAAKAAGTIEDFFAD